MVTATSLPALPDPKSIKDEASASDALCSTLAVVATANRKLATMPREDQPDGLLEDLATFHEHLNGLFKELHELLPKATRFAVLLNPADAPSDREYRECRTLRQTQPLLHDQERAIDIRLDAGRCAHRVDRRLTI